MSEVLGTLDRPKERPFPWYCPRCRKKDVWRDVIRYQCQRVSRGQTVDVVVPDLAVPQCRSCGEFVLDYAAEKQINARSAAMANHLGGFLMQLAAKGVAAAVGAVAGPVGIVAEEAINHFGRPIVQRWWDWLRGKPSSEQEDALQELATLTAVQVGPLALVLVRENAPNADPQTQELAARFLAAIPGAVRRSLVSVPGAGGRLSLPRGLQLQTPDSLLPLLPISVPPFTVPGDLPESPYVLEELIGTGGFGAVYRARIKNSALQYLPFAIKVCLGREMQAALENERKNLERLQACSLSTWSDRIVKLHGHQLDRATPFLVYEFVPGGDLTSFLKRRQQELGGRVEPDEVRGWVLQIVEGLAFAHSQGLIHRDLKPANVLVANGSLKLADFGLGGVVAGYARSHSQISVSAAAQLLPDEQVSLFRGSGTQLYMSDEQREGHSPDPRHDLYSLGVMWFQLLLGDVTKKLPFHWKRVLTTTCRDASDQIELIERCLDPIEDRPANAGELLALMRKPPSPPSIRIESLQPQALTVDAGSSADAVIRIARQNCDEVLTVAVEGLPSTLTAQASPIQAGESESQIHLTAAATATAGETTARIIVRGSEVEGSATLSVTVTQPPLPPRTRIPRPIRTHLCEALRIAVSRLMPQATLRKVIRNHNWRGSGDVWSNIPWVGYRVSRKSAGFAVYADYVAALPPEADRETLFGAVFAGRVAGFADLMVLFVADLPNTATAAREIEREGFVLRPTAHTCHACVIMTPNEFLARPVEDLACDVERLVEVERRLSPTSPPPDGTTLPPINARTVTVAKYRPLREYLAARRDKERVRMTFAEVAAVLGDQLPPSAFKYREWWENPSDPSNRPQAAAWLDAGFLVDTVHQDDTDNWVEFVRQLPTAAEGV